MKILLIEGDKETANSIKEIMKVYYVIDVADTGLKGEDLIFDNDYDAIVSEALLPDIDSFQICRDIRENDIKTPIIILTEKTDIKDKINAFNVGADDYLIKPFNFEELHARLQVLIRRSSSNNFLSDKLSVKGLTLDINSNTAEYNGNIMEIQLI